MTQKEWDTFFELVRRIVMAEPDRPLRERASELYNQAEEHDSTFELAELAAWLQ